MIGSLNSSLGGMLFSPYAQEVLPVRPVVPSALQGSEAVTQEAVAPILRDGQQGQSSAYRQAQQRAGNFSELISPKPRLSPSDEAEIFALDNAFAESDRSSFERSGMRGQGAIYGQETASQAGGAAGSLVAQQQRSVAQLYSKNADVMYQFSPVVSETM